MKQHMRLMAALRLRSQLKFPKSCLVTQRVVDQLL